MPTPSRADFELIFKQAQCNGFVPWGEVIGAFPQPVLGKVEQKASPLGLNVALQMQGKVAALAETPVCFSSKTTVGLSRDFVNLGEEIITDYFGQKNNREQNRSVRISTPAVGENVAIRCDEIPVEYEINYATRCFELLEQPRLRDAVYIAWANAKTYATYGGARGHGRIQKEKSLAHCEDYKNLVRQTLEAMLAVTGEDEVLSILVPRAFMPCRPVHGIQQPEDEQEVYKSYRQSFFEAIAEQLARTDLNGRVILVSGLDPAETIEVLQHREDVFLSPAGSDMYQIEQLLIDSGFSVLSQITADTIRQPGNGAHHGLYGGKCAADERWVRMAPTMWHLFSSRRNPAIKLCVANIFSGDCLENKSEVVSSCLQSQFTFPSASNQSVVRSGDGAEAIISPGQLGGGNGLFSPSAKKSVSTSGGKKSNIPSSCCIS